MNFNLFTNNNKSVSEPDGILNGEGARLHGNQPETEAGNNYHKYGFLQSKNHGADTTALQVELKKIMEQFRETTRRDEHQQEQLKLPIRKNIEGCKAESEKLKTDIQKIKTEEIFQLNQKIGLENNAISEVRKNPELYQKEKPNRLSFYFGFVVFSLLTVYLWIFYTSASYSAFFRKFEVDDINVANSIFDARALSKAYADGVPAFVLVISMPFIFLALGYLIHKYLEKEGWKKYFSLAFLIVVTFGFDYIIAFEIVKKIYDLKVLNSLSEMPEYSAQMAINDINFWLIIFAGFVTYLIWGFLFDKLMFTYEQFDAVKTQVRIRQRAIKALDKEIKKKEAEIKQIESRIFELEKQVKRLNQDLEATFFKQEDFEHILYQFGSGWMQFIEGGLIMSEDRKKALRGSTKSTIENFILENNNGILYEDV